jgi:hypothetical protein
LARPRQLYINQFCFLKSLAKVTPPRKTPEFFKSLDLRPGIRQKDIKQPLPAFIRHKLAIYSLFTRYKLAPGSKKYRVNGDITAVIMRLNMSASKKKLCFDIKIYKNMACLSIAGKRVSYSITSAFLMA